MLLFSLKLFQSDTSIRKLLALFNPLQAANPAFVQQLTIEVLNHTSISEAQIPITQTAEIIISLIEKSPSFADNIALELPPQSKKETQSRMGSARILHDRTQKYTSETGACTLVDGRCTEAASGLNGLDI